MDPLKVLGKKLGLFSWLLASARYSSMPQMTVAPPLSARVITRSVLFFSSERALRCGLVK